MRTAAAARINDVLIDVTDFAVTSLQYGDAPVQTCAQ